MNTRDRIKEGLGEKITAWQEKSAQRIYFSVDKKDILSTAEFLFRKLGLRFSIATGTEKPQGLEILYHFCYDPAGEVYSVRVLIEDKAHAAIDSITPLFPGAEWIEREIWELLGVHFNGHPNLKRLLLAEDWPEGDYPMRQKT
jgi:Ni,Fe-hydrogenase III component G